MSADLQKIHRLLPQSPDAEQGILSSFLIAPREVYGLCTEKELRPEQFHIPAHTTIYSRLCQMSESPQQIDIITLTQQLRNHNELDQCGGAGFVSQLCTYLPTAANAAFYLAIIQEKFTLREIIRVCTEYAARSYEYQDELQTLLDELEERVLAIRGDRDEADGMAEMSGKDAAISALNDIEQMYERRGKISGLTTGFRELDMLTDGLHAEDFVVIGARPSMGKTALLMDLAIHVALNGHRVVVFSAEMSTRQLSQRALCSLASVNIRNVRDGLLSERDFPALTAVASKLAASKLIFLDAVGATINAVRAKARRLHRKAPLGLIVVDYLQKLRHPPSAKFREREIAEVSEGLKNLNKELKVPVVTAAQINRQGADGPPRIQHLRESGSIEADADVILLLDRPEVYAQGEIEKKEAEGLANLEIAKQRNGPLGEVRLTFLKEFTRFETRAYEPE